MRVFRFALALVLLAPAPALAQQSGITDLVRSNPKFLQAFRDVVVRPSESTVRVQCDGKDTALGMVVEADGWILTKANDLKGDVTVRLKDGRSYPAKITGIHKIHDLALLKIEATGLNPVSLKESKKTRVGSWVAAAGIGEDPVAVGVVSVATRDVPPGKGGPPAPNPSSGYLGVMLETASEGGVRVTQVMPNTAASKAGFQAKDIILKVADEEVTEHEQFMLKMGKRKPGEVVTFRIRRGEDEKDIVATLQARPKGANRGDIQNAMGSELSSRRTGYPTILQHDSVVKPVDCGGPLVDLDGNVIGINICRAGRVESWAVPAEVIRAVLPDLKSGKLAPTAADLTRLSPEMVDSLLASMNRRLQLMPDVARAKWNEKQEVHDPKREAELLDRLAEEAPQHGLDKADVRRFFEAQIEAARLVQDNLFKEWKEKKADRFKGTFDLQSTLRPRVTQASRDLLAAYAKLQPYVGTDEFQKMLRDRARTTITGDSITDAVRDRALQGLSKR